MGTKGQGSLLCLPFPRPLLCPSSHLSPRCWGSGRLNNQPEATQDSNPQIWVSKAIPYRQPVVPSWEQRHDASGSPAWLDTAPLLALGLTLPPPFPSSQLQSTFRLGAAAALGLAREAQEGSRASSELQSLLPQSAQDFSKMVLVTVPSANPCLGRLLPAPPPSSADIPRAPAGLWD